MIVIKVALFALALTSYLVAKRVQRKALELSTLQDSPIYNKVWLKHYVNTATLLLFGSLMIFLGTLILNWSSLLILPFGIWLSFSTLRRVKKLEIEQELRVKNARKNRVITRGYRGFDEVKRDLDND